MGGKSSKTKDKPKDAKADNKKTADKTKQDKNKKGGDKKVVLDENTISVLLSNTHLKRDDILKVHEDFIKDCPSGLIDKKEFLKMFKSMHPLDSKKAKPDSYCALAFNAYDKDHNGKIDFSEYVYAHLALSSRDTKTKAEFAFKHYDANNDGKVNTNDIVKLLTSLYDLNGVDAKLRKGDSDPKKQAENVMKKLDVNKKNAVTLNEFKEACANDQALRATLVDQLFSN